MGFLKILIGLPVLVIILIFAHFNNDLATFNLLPFDLELTVPLSVAILFFILLGFLLGGIFSWMSYAPLRKELRQQRKENKKLSKQQQILTETVSDLQGDLERAKNQGDSSQPEKSGWLGFFKKKQTEEPFKNSGVE